MFIELPHEIVELKFSCILRDYWCIDQPIDLDKLQGSSKTPLHFIFRYKGDSVGRYRRYPLVRFSDQKQPSLIQGMAD